MALNVGDIIQITDVQSLFGQQVLNVYFYEMMSMESGVTLDVVSDQWQTTILPNIRSSQGADLLHVSRIAKNLTNGIDIDEQPIGLAGQATGETLASFYAAAFRLVRTTAITRHGAKRIAGWTENLVAGNTLSAAGVTQATGVADVLDNSIVTTGTLDQDFVARPVIIGRVPQGEPHSGELDLSVINPVAAAQFIRLSTQTTRRAGRGS